jgi:hypothetical protein
VPSRKEPPEEGSEGSYSLRREEAEADDLIDHGHHHE